jgi:hypothetical protein
MNRRTFLSAVLVVPIAAALAACGNDDTATNPTLPQGGTDTFPPVASVGIAHPTGAGDVVIKLSYEGGFAPAGSAFTNPPALLVSGDGLVYTPAVIPAIFPGPLVPPMLTRTISEPGVQQMLGILKRDGLLAPPPDYTGGEGVADATTTVLTINADGGNFVHSAYALGADTPESPARKQLIDATAAIGDLGGAAGEDNLGENQPFVPTSYRFQARAVDPSELATDIPPTIVDWPALTTLPLADATTCATLDAVSGAPLFADAKQNTYFKDGDVVYQLSVAGVLPGDAPC